MPMAFDWKGVLGTVAPGLATAIGGPLAGMAVAAIGKALGVEPTQESVQTALAGAKPEDLLKLKVAEQQFLKDMKALDIDLERISASDRDSARKREAEVKDSTPRVLAYLVVCAFIGVVVATLAGWSKVESVLAGTLIGYLSAKAEQVIAYYFGSSAGSKGKDATIKAMSK